MSTPECIEPTSRDNSDASGTEDQDIMQEQIQEQIPISVSLWNEMVDPVFDGVGLAGFKSRSNAFLLA